MLQHATYSMHSCGFHLATATTNNLQPEQKAQASGCWNAMGCRKIRQGSKQLTIHRKGRTAPPVLKLSIGTVLYSSVRLRSLPCHAMPCRPSCYDIDAATQLQLVCKPARWARDQCIDTIDYVNQVAIQQLQFKICQEPIDRSKYSAHSV